MPMPKPKKDEKKEDFLKRCMADTVMNDEYDDEKQRYAVCQTIWKDKDKKEINIGIERRFLTDTEVRVITNDDKIPRIIGHAAVFNKLSEDLGGFREKIEPGAFKKTIKNSDIRALKNHNSDYVLGRNKNGTLKLKEDEIGLYSEIIPPGTQWANDFLVSIDRGDITGMSFGFRTITDNWEIKDKENIRTLLEAEVYDISPVTFPAYLDTDVQVRSIFDNIGINFNDMQKILVRHEHGLGINEDDKKLINDFIDKLNNVLNERMLNSEDDQDMPMHSLGILRRRLSLKLKYLGGSIK